jgi:Mg2+-importing ATPase
LLSGLFDHIPGENCISIGYLIKIDSHWESGQVRTGWFLESIISASVIVLVIRSRKPFFRSRPGKYLLMATLSIAVITLILPFTPLGNVFGFSPLSLSTYLLLLLIVAVYIIAAEITKTIFYKKVKF